MSHRTAFYLELIVLIKLLIIKPVFLSTLSYPYLELNDDYRIYYKEARWQEALEFCSKCVGSFATFETPEESNTIQNLIYNISVFHELTNQEHSKDELGLEQRYWFGLSDEKKEGTWLWTKKLKEAGIPVENVKDYPWYPGQPDHYKHKDKVEHCAGFWNPVYHKDTFKLGIGDRKELHSFNDFSCRTKLFFICKQDRYDADEPNNEICYQKDPVKATSTSWEPSADLDLDDKNSRKRDLLKETEDKDTGNFTWVEEYMKTFLEVIKRVQLLLFNWNGSEKSEGAAKEHETRQVETNSNSDHSEDSSSKYIQIVFVLFASSAVLLFAFANLYLFLFILRKIFIIN